MNVFPVQGTQMGDCDGEGVVSDNKRGCSSRRSLRRRSKLNLYSVPGPQFTVGAAEGIGVEIVGAADGMKLAVGDAEGDVDGAVVGAGVAVGALVGGSVGFCFVKYLRGGGRQI